MEFDFVERAVDIQLKGGKMTKKKVEHMKKVVTSCGTGWGPPGYHHIYIQQPDISQ